MAKSNGTSDRSNAADDDVVIDITDAALARQALYDRLVSTSPTGELVIDLRDEVLDSLALLAPTGRKVTPSAMASGRPPDLEAGLNVQIIEDGPDWWRAEEFVYETYVKLGYTEENRDHQVAELAKYRHRSRFYTAQRDDGTIIGTTRAIFGRFDELPIGRFQRIDFADDDPMCELSSIVVDPHQRSKGVLEHLCRAGWIDGLRTGAQTLAALGEEWMINWFRTVYCMPFVPSAAPEWYMGATIVPMTMAMSPEGFAEVARENPEFWWWNLEALEPDDVERLGLAELTRDALAQA